MKSLLLVVCFLIIGNVASAHEVTFSVPASLPVVNADLVLDPGKSTESIIRAPWMMADLTVDNRSKHAVRVDHMDVKCTSGFNSYDRRLIIDKTIEANSSEHVANFIDALPESADFQYECIAVLQWTGPHHSHLDSFRFISE